MCTPACGASAASSACAPCPSCWRSCGPVSSSDRLLLRCTFPPAGAQVTCAVSGGADSLALLALACAADCRVTAVHVDPPLRPGSPAEADLVAAAAQQPGPPFPAQRPPVEPGPNQE